MTEGTTESRSQHGGKSEHSLGWGRDAPVHGQRLAQRTQTESGVPEEFSDLGSADLRVGRRGLKPAVLRSLLSVLRSQLSVLRSLLSWGHCCLTWNHCCLSRCHCYLSWGHCCLSRGHCCPEVTAVCPGVTAVRGHHFLLSQACCFSLCGSMWGGAHINQEVSPGHRDGMW